MDQMFEGQEFTPFTTLSQGVNATETRIYLTSLNDADGHAVFPDAPNLASIFIPGTGTGEVVQYTLAGTDTTGAFVDVIRGQSGAAQSWDAGTRIGRYFTAKDLKALQNNVIALYAEKAEKSVERIANRIYTGVDITVAFAAEIAVAPYNGDPWAWIKARAQAGNFTGLFVGDYIPFVAAGNNIKAEIAGMDTYYQYADVAIGHHIDFISRDCWPTDHVYNKVNYNNGTTVSPSPWLASDIYAWLNSLSMSVPNAATANPALVAVNYTTTGVYDKLPAALKAVIVQKRLLLPLRYTAGSLLTADNNWAWADAGKLWLPFEVEVYGCEHWGSKNGYSGGGHQQYPIFAQNMKRIKGVGDGGDSSDWWLSTARGGTSAACASVVHYGNAGSSSASTATVRAPLCFRIA